MGSAKNLSMILVLLMTLFGVSSGVLYTVGDIHGWNNYSSVDYMTWSSTKQFHIGDFIRFKYNPRDDNVVRVTHKNFRACNATKPIHVFNSGEDIVPIRNLHSHLYFISSATGHCEAGQKVDVRVYRPSHSGQRSAPAPSPSQTDVSSSPPYSDESASERSLPSLVATMLLLVATSFSFLL